MTTVIIYRCITKINICSIKVQSEVRIVILRYSRHKDIIEKLALRITSTVN